MKQETLGAKFPTKIIKPDQGGAMKEKVFFHIVVTVPFGFFVFLKDCYGNLSDRAFCFLLGK